MSAWAFARQDLGLTSEEFWGLTPREYRALADRWVERESLVDLRFGVLGASLASAFGAKRQDGGPLRPDDIYASLRAHQQPSATRRRGSNAIGARAAGVGDVHDAIADAWLAWADKANEVAEQRGRATGRARP